MVRVPLFHGRKVKREWAREQTRSRLSLLKYKKPTAKISNTFVVIDMRVMSSQSQNLILCPPLSITILGVSGFLLL